MITYINSKNRLQIKSINFNIFTYSLEHYEKLTFKKSFARIFVIQIVIEITIYKCEVIQKFMNEFL